MSSNKTSSASESQRQQQPQPQPQQLTTTTNTNTSSESADSASDIRVKASSVSPPLKKRILQSSSLSPQPQHSPPKDTPTPTTTMLQGIPLDPSSSSSTLQTTLITKGGVVGGDSTSTPAKKQSVAPAASSPSTQQQQQLPHTPYTEPVSSSAVAATSVRQGSESPESVASVTYSRKAVVDPATRGNYDDEDEDTDHPPDPEDEIGGVRSSQHGVGIRNTRKPLRKPIDSLSSTANVITTTASVVADSIAGASTSPSTLRTRSRSHSAGKLLSFQSTTASMAAADRDDFVRSEASSSKTETFNNNNVYALGSPKKSKDTVMKSCVVQSNTSDNVQDESGKKRMRLCLGI